MRDPADDIGHRHNGRDDTTRQQRQHDDDGAHDQQEDRSYNAHGDRRRMARRGRAFARGLQRGIAYGQRRGSPFDRGSAVDDRRDRVGSAPSSRLHDLLVGHVRRREHVACRRDDVPQTTDIIQTLRDRPDERPGFREADIDARQFLQHRGVHRRAGGHGAHNDHVAQAAKAPDPPATSCQFHQVHHHAILLRGGDVAEVDCLIQRDEWLVQHRHVGWHDTGLTLGFRTGDVRIGPYPARGHVRVNLVDDL